MEQKQVMWELKMFEKEKTEASEKFRRLNKESLPSVCTHFGMDHINCGIATSDFFSS